MHTEEMFSKLRDSIIDFKTDEIGEIAKEAMDAGISPFDIITQGMSKGMEIIGRRFERQEAWLADLIMAGETMKVGMEVLKPYLEKNPGKKAAVVVIGTVKGDIHDIGKNIIKSLLIAKGFDVRDLGTNVPIEEFVVAMRENDTHILGLSSLLSVGLAEIKSTIDAISQAGLRKKMKIIVGGGALTQEYAESLGADSYGKDAVIGADMCEKWVKTSF